MLKQKIVYDMVNMGYDKTMIIDILEKRLTNNTNIINNEYLKLKHKLSKKFSEEELERKIIQKLQQKGFSFEEIKKINN